MANPVGVFDVSALPSGWFDAEATPAGWFDADFLAPASAGGTVYLNLDTRALSITKPAALFKLTLSVGTRAILAVAQSIAMSMHATLAIGTAVLGIARQAVQFKLNLAVASKAVLIQKNPVQNILRFGIASRGITLAGQSMQPVLRFALSSKTVQYVGKDVQFLQITPPVLLEIARYVWGVQGAPISLGAGASVQGAVVPRAILQAWLWQNQQEVLAERGCVCILRSGTVIFVVG